MEFIKKEAVVKSSSTKPITKKAFDHLRTNESSSKSSSMKSTKENRAPPPAPMPPRLPTPDLSDLECGEFCECCGGSTMDKQLAAAKLYISQSGSRVVPGTEYERKNGRALRLEAGKGKQA